MTDCTSCGAETELFLCGRCTADLQDTLRGLAIGVATDPRTGVSRPAASPLDYLQDAALGQTRLGESERRSTDMTSPMPVNLGASHLLDDIHGVLQYWALAVSMSAETLGDGQ